MHDTQRLLDVMLALVATHAPRWVLSYVELNVNAATRTVELRGALPNTMHMGCARLALDTGVLVFIDEDLRDAYDTEDGRVTLGAEELAHVLLAMPRR